VGQYEDTSIQPVFRLSCTTHSAFSANHLIDTIKTTTLNYNKKQHIKLE